MPNFALEDQVFADAADRFPTPFHLYSESCIRQTARRLYRAFSGVPFREYFAVKALPNPSVLRILKEEGCGVDCASRTELMLAEALGFAGEDILFSANNVPPAEFAYARKLGAHINLDDLTHVDVLAENGGMPEVICLRYNPGGNFVVGNQIMGNPGQAKYGMTRAQLSEALFKCRSYGAKAFGLHSFLVSNTTDPEYYPALARLLFETAAELARETGMPVRFIDLSGGVGIPYRPDEPAADIERIGAGVAAAYREVFTAQGMQGVRIFSELGRYMTGPNGWLLTRMANEKNIYKRYIGVDASACDLMRPAMYGAYHHITVPGKEHLPHDEKVDVTGSLCENNDKFAVDRMLPHCEKGDLLVIHDTGAHGLSMGYNYNGKLRCAEVLHAQDGSFRLIRRAEKPSDYFATLDSDPVWEKLNALA
ncbi:MAG: diaminopimelate decarboxylase [Eubacteriales bacterium]|nr:diaminopimelate decarboxylase [Eubacteriales bacterium]